MINICKFGSIQSPAALQRPSGTLEQLSSSLQAALEQRLNSSRTAFETFTNSPRTGIDHASFKELITFTVSCILGRARLQMTDRNCYFMKMK